MTKRRLRAAFPAAIVIALGCGGAAHATTSADSLREASTLPNWFDSLDRIERERYLRRHAFSLDHFLEFEPGGFVVRLGPIGNQAYYSRWGIGLGRAQLRMNGIPLNDPQDDTPPLVHTATSGLGTLKLAGGTGGSQWIEGALYLDDEAPAVGRTNTFIELEKGTNSVRQRRARFSSEKSTIGVDLSYDEVLDDGYAFDGSGTVENIPDYGRAQTRNSGLVLRGDPDNGSHFDFGVRNFTSTTQGDLESNTAEGRKSGHVVWIDATVAGTGMTLFSRGYASSVPDSSAESETVGAIATWERAWRAAGEVAFRASVEETNAVQNVGGGAGVTANNDLVRASFEADASRQAGDHGSLNVTATVAGDEETPLAWGASVGTRLVAGRNSIGLSLARSFRLPNFGERYLPAHGDSVLTLAGNADVEPETALEVGGDWGLRLDARGHSVNRVRAAWVTSEGAIAFRPRAVGAETWYVASNSPDQRTMLFVEERLSIDWEGDTYRFLADASVLYTTGDREDAFTSVPKLQTNASFLVGRNFFEKTSALYIGAGYQSVDERSDYGGTPLPSFQVLNLALEGRLLDARLYLQYLNVLDEMYQTAGNYLMTPRSFVYGIEWTLFN